ncbi:uncharacterized protein LOC135136544 [Zophobas morio]|uniref:uncharacterized protein LOC135136544 n=1 Tax=Zophobas morio TaxID=2755281 RepID=UPI003082D7CA
MGTTTLTMSQKLCSFFLLMSLYLKNSKSESYTGHSLVSLQSEDFATVETITKNLRKRPNSAQEETDEIFKQLKLELSASNTERILTAKEEKEESAKIFDELFEETSSPKPVGRGNQESEAIHRITDTIAKFVFRGRKSGSDNSNILSLISNVFNYRNR